MLSKAIMALMIGSALLVAGCQDSKDKSATLTVEKMKIPKASSNNKYGKVGKEIKNVRVQLFGPKKPGMFGGKGTEQVVKGATVVFEVVNADKTGMMLVVDGKETIKAERVTDVSGQAGVSLKLGAKRIGDQYVKAYYKENPKKNATFRFIAGVEVDLVKEKKQIDAGNSSEPITVTLTDTLGKPRANVPVHFNITSYAANDVKKKGKLKKSASKTDGNGQVNFVFTPNKDTTGTYHVTFEVEGTDGAPGVRGVVLKLYSLKVGGLTGLFITVAGALAIFILGMKQMTDGLQTVAGNKLKTILGYFAKNRVVAVITGMVVTGFIQSSSACTVLVVGFVNAGLLQLKQAIGVIFGANIGTTITAQMIAFKLNGFALPAIIIGVVALMLLKRTKARGWATVVLGFGLLFFGMTIMGAELKQLKDFPTIISFFQKFDCTPTATVMPFGNVLGAIFIGTIMTVLIQSSSATIGLTIALASSGLINFYTAVPLILGDNIGTTITAILASIGGNKNAKRAAVAHTTFNVFGTLYMIALFYLPYGGKPVYLYFINWMTDGNVFAAEPENIARHIANTHTFFNVFNVFMMVPLIGLFVKICHTVIPLRPEEKEVESNLLEPRLIATPSVALQQAISQIELMTSKSWDMLTKSMNVLKTRDFSSKEKLEEQEEEIDQMQTEIIDYLTDLTKVQLDSRQAATVPMLMHCTNNAERMGDNAEDIVALAERLNKSNNFSDDQCREIDQIFAVLTEKMAIIEETFKGHKSARTKDMIKTDLELKEMLVKFESEDIATMQKDSKDVLSGVLFIELINILGKLNGRLTNIWERINKLRKQEVIVTQD